MCFETVERRLLCYENRGYTIFVACVQAMAMPRHRNGLRYIAPPHYESSRVEDMEALTMKECTSELYYELLIGMA